MKLIALFLTAAALLTVSPVQSSGSNPRRSLLANASSQPSQKVTEIIKEREKSGGPGWIGTAFLVSMLSRHDLSDSDRSWIQQQIDRNSGDSGEGDTVSLLAPVKPNVKFNYVGLLQTYQVGNKVVVTVNAKRLDTALLVSCSIGGIQAAQVGKESKVLWEPKEPGVQILKCKAGDQSDRKLVKITQARELK